MKDNSVDIIPESEKEIFKNEKIDKQELETVLNNRVNTVIDRIIRRDV